jgi:hypothetical protein
MSTRTETLSLGQRADTALTGDAVVDGLTPLRLTVQRLRNTLRANASTSFAGGAVASIVPGRLALLLGVSQPMFVRLVGFGLIGFSAVVFGSSGARTTRLLPATRIIVAADVAWVVASGATVVAGWYSRRGDILVAAVAGMVAMFATRQARSQRAANAISAGGSSSFADIDEHPPVEVVHVERAINASVDEAWRVVTDHELYGRLAPNLGGVRATAPNGLGLTRTCTNRSGEEWHETCTLWTDQPGREHRFDVAVDTTNYPYPLRTMNGSWWVRPTGDPQRVLVGMDFRFQPRSGVRGRLFAAIMHAAFPVVLRRILTGWKNHVQLTDKDHSEAERRPNER